MGINLKKYNMKIVYLLLFNILLWGCSKTYLSKKVIQNTSAQTIRVFTYSKIYNKFIDSIIVVEKSEAIIEQLGPTQEGLEYISAEGCANPLNVSTILEVYNKPSLKVAKDITNSDNWAFNKSSGQREVTVECRFTITDADIVPK
jgi:hypothetical protein